MQYNEPTSVVKNLQRLGALITNLMTMHIQFNLPLPCQQEEELHIPITLAYYRDKKDYYIFNQQGILAVSNRQLECLQCAVDGLTTKETAKQLGISCRIVESYLEIIRKKLSCSNRVQLVKNLLTLQVLKEFA